MEGADEARSLESLLRPLFLDVDHSAPLSTALVPTHPPPHQVYFGNHFALEGASRKKSEICASVGAQVLIDDNVGYALECAHRGISVLLFDWEGGYPWSKPPPG